MPEIWFISDTHFGHKNILEYEKEARPFKSVEEMNEAIISNWNSVVRSNDIVYHLGDFCFGKSNLHIARRLQGHKKLVMGNHDTYPPADYLLFFDKLYGVLFWEHCILSHVPVHPVIPINRGLLNVHGHLHSKKVRYPILAPDENGNTIYHEDNNYFNVSCEQNNLTPINADVIRERVKEIKKVLLTQD